MTRLRCADGRADIHHSRKPVVAARMTLSTHGSTMTSLIFVTGGVVSSLGKGIASASLASSRPAAST
jgi:hypothetical protein